MFNVTLKLHSHRAVIPTASQSAIDFTAGENKASALTQRNNFLHIYIGRHYYISFFLSSLAYQLCLLGVKGYSAHYVIISFRATISFNEIQDY
jgi:hypothetical protein